MTKKRSRPDAPPERAAAPAPGDGAAARAALALWVTLVVLALARAALAFVPSMTGWGLNLQRFLAPAWAWAPWAIAALALVPALARRAVPLAARAGDAIARGRVPAGGGWGFDLAAKAFAAVLVLVLPDRVRFVGDFILRQGAIEEAGLPSALFPQALPLDVLLHVTLPAALAGTGLVGANGAARLVGAAEAVLLVTLALAFARALTLRGVPALATAAAVFFGGYLGLYAGYSKANGELALITVTVAVLGLRVARDAARGPSGAAAPFGLRRDLLALGFVLGVGAFLHRSVLGLVPAVVLAFALALRGRPAAWRDPALWVAVALPVAGFAFTLGRIVTTLTRFDPGMHLASPEVRAQGGLLASMFAGARALDLPNVVVLLAPLAPALLVMAAAWGRRLPRGRPAALLVTLAAPFIGLLLFVHPGQGAFRDYDTLSGGGVVLALLAAWLAGETLRRAPARAWVGVGVVLAVAVPSVQWLAHNGDVDRGLARVRAFMTEPPARDPFERGRTWDYLGARNFRLQRWEAAAEAFAHASETQPSPRILTQWAMAETESGNLRGAQEVYRRAIARDSANTTAWLGLGAVSSRLGELDEARRAVLELLRRDPGNVEAQSALRQLDRLLAAQGRAAP